MYQHISIAKAASTTEISNVYPQVVRPQTSGLEDRLSYSFKSLFTLADVAAKRRANRSFRNLMSQTDENASDGGGLEDVGSAFLKRSKSSGDVAVFGDSPGHLNAGSGTDASAAPAKPTKGLRTRAATTPPSPRSKIPKAKPAAWSQIVNTSFENDSKSSISTRSELDDAGALKVDDAVFVMITPPQTPKKLLTLAAHAPSLPRIASPFSPRTNQACPAQPLRVNPATPRSTPTTGHTAASLHLTKSHWELRYETWTRSRRTQRSPTTAVNPQLTPSRSRFPEPLTNPALFPRAGSLTPMALRPVLDGIVVDDDARPALELDWAMRAWPLDKIQRMLFVHDMDIRAWFPIRENVGDLDARDAREQEAISELELARKASLKAGQDEDREMERSLRRWEWDWELRWKVIEGMAEDDMADRAECEYDVFLAEEDQGDDAYGGCEIKEEAGAGVMVETDWEWSEDAMEVDSIL